MRKMGYTDFLYSDSATFFVQSVSMNTTNATNQNIIVSKGALWIVLILCIAIPIRLAALREPLASDDNALMNGANRILQGTHPIQQQIPPDVNRGAYMHLLRIGIGIPVALLMSIFGYTFITYYTFSLLFSFLAIILIFLFLRRFVGNWLAFLASLVHIVNPVEVFYSSNLLSDLPAATLTVLYVYLFSCYLNTRRKWKTIIIGLAGGIILSWLYFMRVNGPIFLLPCFLVCVFDKKYRVPCLISICVLCVAVLSEQFLYMMRGGVFGFHFYIEAGVKEFIPFMPRYNTLWEYLFRYPISISRTTNFGVAVLFCIAFVSHVYLVIFARDKLLRALVAGGLMNFLIFSYTLFAPLSEGFVTNIASYRFIQLYLLTSVICVPWSLVHLNQDLTPLLVRGYNRFCRNREGTVKRFKVASSKILTAACFLAFLLPLAYGTYSLPRPLFSENGRYFPILREINLIMKRNNIDSVEIMGTWLGLRGIQIFTWLPPDKRIKYKIVSVERCIKAIEKGSVDLFLTDFRKERYKLRYIKSKQELKKRIEAIDRLEHLVLKRLQVIFKKKGTILAMRA